MSGSLPSHHTQAKKPITANPNKPTMNFISLLPFPAATNRSLH